jgi:hypothetical protein
LLFNIIALIIGVCVWVFIFIYIPWYYTRGHHHRDSNNYYVYYD